MYLRRGSFLKMPVVAANGATITFLYFSVTLATASVTGEEYGPIEEPFVQAYAGGRHRLIVVDDELDLPPEQSALGIEILLAELIPLVLVLAELRIRTRERQGGADPNGRLGVGVERSDEYEGGCHDDDDHEEDLLLERGSGTARL